MSNHRRFFIDPSQIEDGTARITGDGARQIGKVLRLKEGDFICLLDGSGNEHDAHDQRRHARYRHCPDTGHRVMHARARLTLNLALCLPKGDKVELDRWEMH